MDMLKRNLTLAEERSQKAQRTLHTTTNKEEQAEATGTLHNATTHISFLKDMLDKFVNSADPEATLPVLQLAIADIARGIARVSGGAVPETPAPEGPVVAGATLAGAPAGTLDPDASSAPPRPASATPRSKPLDPAAPSTPPCKTTVLGEDPEPSPPEGSVDPAPVTEMTNTSNAVDPASVDPEPRDHTAREVADVD